MADEAKTEAPKVEKPKLRRFDGSDVERFAKAKGVSLACPMCEQDNWELQDYEDWSGVGAKVVCMDKSLGKKYVPFLLLLCTNCAYAWLLSRVAFEQWQDANPKSMEDPTHE